MEDWFNKYGKGKEGLTPAHLLDTLPLPVEFTAHIPPPSYIPSQHVLIQVFAVGIDSLDSLLVHEKAGLNGKGAGFIPGRSIVGKVIEMGWEVKEDVCRKGEWVIGLLDVRKVSDSIDSTLCRLCPLGPVLITPSLVWCPSSIHRG